MNNLEFQLRGVGDPRLAVHAASALPAWLWSVDGTRILWANPVGARLFGAANAAALAQKTFGPADSQRRQVAQLAGRLPPSGAIRLERLRGFGASPGMLVTCGCARLTFADGSHGILVAAADPVGRAMPLVERLQRLVEGIDSPIAVFARDGLFIGASNAARSLLGFHDLSEPKLAQARHDALRQGRVELPIGIGHLVLQRVGTGADIGIVALIATGALPKAPSPAVPHVAPPASSDARATCDGLATSNDAPAASSDAPVIPPAEAAPDYEQPALSNEAPAEFALFDEFAAQPVAAVADERSEPDLQSVLQLDVPHLEATPDQQPAEPSAAEAEVEHQPSPSLPSLQEPQRQESQFEEAQHHEPLLQEPLQEVLPQRSAPHEPSPYVEPVADEPSAAPLTSLPLAPPAHDDAPPASAAPSWRDEPMPVTRKHPLRFIWQMDADGRFSIRSDEFTQLIGAHTAAGFGRLWRDIAETFELDPAGRVSAAVATRDTWSGITLDWPVDGGGRLPVELSGLPIFDRDHQFAGYRGFGVCRDLDALARVAALRRYELSSAAPAPQALSAGIVSASAVSAERVSVDHASVDPASVDHASTSPSGQDPDANGDLSVSPQPSTPAAGEISQQADLETSVESSLQPDETARVSPLNVVPFRSNGELKSPVLSPVENSAFNELARQLAERLERENVAPPPASMPEAPPDVQPPNEASAEPPAIAETSAAGAQPDWLSQPEPPARGESRRDRTLLDLLPMGVLIYRLDRLLYANTAFLARMGYPSLQALEEAGGLDALYVEPGVSSTSSTSDTGTPVRISAGEAATEATTPSVTDARLHTISWDGDSALALIFAGAPALEDHTTPQTGAVAEPVALAEPSAVGHANAEELGAILDTTAEGILMFDAEGNINSCNRSAEALFGRDGGELVQFNLADLFAPESRPEVRDYLETIKGADIASVLEHGRDVLAQVRGGGLIPVSMTIGRTQAHGPNFFAVFRDQSQSRKSQNELREAQRLMNRAGNAKSDMLARISHEIRTPLNAIIGFADVMIGERFGALGNERYVEYMKDIRASGERVIAIINDLLDLSRIETGKLDLAFADQNLNDLVEQCVSGMQSQANRERIIIRTSLAHALPPVIADARALRQITLNLIGNSIHLANAGGQVIVSTALSDSGEVVLRVRDTGHGLNDNEVAAAMEPFRTPPPSDQASDSSGVSLSLTRALVEANRARFQIKTGGRSGTLIEVVFPHAMART